MNISMLSLPEIQEMVLGIWGKCLERDAISLDENFFDLGGNSISAMYIATLLSESFSMDLPFQRILELKDVRAVAEFLFHNARNKDTSRTRIMVGSGG
jgi:acyl carrier protein